MAFYPGMYFSRIIPIQIKRLFADAERCTTSSKRLIEDVRTVTQYFISEKKRHPNSIEVGQTSKTTSLIREGKKERAVFLCQLGPLTLSYIEIRSVPYRDDDSDIKVRVRVKDHYGTACRIAMKGDQVLARFLAGGVWRRQIESAAQEVRDIKGRLKSSAQPKP
ncbi:MAG: hypothetical protein EOM37_02595 [Proteobacteria bacterium]|nr:hypothetical protein [Pseudomonadota bacterium]